MSIIVDPSLAQARGPRGAGVGGFMEAESQNGAPVRGALLVASQDSDKKSFFISTPAGGLAPTAAMDIFGLFESNSASTRMKIRRLIIWNPGLQTAAGLVELSVGLVTGASPALSSPPGRFAQPDTEGNNVAIGVASAGGTFVATMPFIVPVFVPAAVAAFQPIIIEWPSAHALGKSFSTGPAGTTYFVVRHPGAAGAAGFRATLEYTEHLTPNPSPVI